jgi:hypothetical protein
VNPLNLNRPGREEAMKKKKHRFDNTDSVHCLTFTSYYCPTEIFHYAFDISRYRQRKEEMEEACKKLSISNRVKATMNLEFVAYDMLHFGFSMGYLIGQMYNIKDRTHLPALKKLFSKITNKENPSVKEKRSTGEKGLLPYLPRERRTTP